MTVSPSKALVAGLMVAVLSGCNEPVTTTDNQATSIYINGQIVSVDDNVGTVEAIAVKVRTMSTYERYHGERLVPMNTCITHIPLPTCSIIFSLRKHSCPLSPVACSVTRNALKQKAGINAPAPNHSKGILSVQERRVYACAFALNDTCRATDE